MDNCHASIEAATEDELMEQVSAHAEERHPDVELDDDFVSSIKAQIIEV